MTWRNWMWRGAWFAWLLVLTLPMLAFLIPINLIESQSGTDRIIGNVAIIGSVLLLLVFYNWLNVNGNRIRIGFFPFYWRTLPISEIRHVSRAEFEPTRDFSGWGLKGTAKSPKGLLLGGNPTHGIAIVTHDGRRYVLSFPEPEPILKALEEHGCTLAAGNEDVLSREG